MIRSTFWIVESRWAMMIEVRPTMSFARASWMRCSVSVSTELVASSSTSRISGLNAIARANAMSCFWPTESVEPRSVTKDPVALVVREAHVVEGDLAAHVRQFAGMWRVDDRRSRVEEPEDPLRRRHRRLHDVVLLREVADGLEEPVDELPEREKGPDRHLPLQDPEAAGDEECGARGGARETDGREEHGHRPDLAPVRVQQIGIQIVELLERRALASEQLHDRHAREVLVQIGVDPREPDADRAERVAHDPPEVHGQPDQEWQRGEGDERETEIEHQEDDRDRSDDDDVAEDRDDTLRDHVDQRVDVVGDPRHEAADGVMVEERQ